MGNKKLSEVVAETEEQKRRENGVDDIKLMELNITIRAGSVDDIIGLIPRVTGDFIQGNEKIGSWCGHDSNYAFRLSGE